MKKAIALCLSLACVGSMMTTSFAAEMPKQADNITTIELNVDRAADLSLFNEPIHGNGPYVSDRAYRDNGKYIQCWFRNDTNATVRFWVTYDSDGKDLCFDHKCSVAPGDNCVEYFTLPEEHDGDRLYLHFSCTNVTVSGEAAIGQYVSEPL